MKKITLLIILFILSGCTETQKTGVTSSNPADVKPNVQFSISSFSLDYEKNKIGVGDGDETYSGTGIITVSGDPESAKKPYLVLIDVKKVNGGDKNNKDGQEHVVVVNGTGKFNTNDWAYENLPMIKPEYEFNIIGYIPYIEIVNEVK